MATAPSTPSPSASSPSASSSSGSSTIAPYTPTNLPIGQPLTLLLPIIPGTNPQVILDAFQTAAPTIIGALNEMQIVHYLRLMVLDRSQPNLQLTATPNLETLVLAIITNYDDTFEAYITKFASLLGDFYTDMLQYVVGGAAIGNVSDNPQAFIDFVQKNDASNVPPGQTTTSMSAYPTLTVADIWADAGIVVPTGG